MLVDKLRHRMTYLIVVCIEINFCTVKEESWNDIAQNMHSKSTEL